MLAEGVDKARQEGIHLFKRQVELGGKMLADGLDLRLWCQSALPIGGEGLFLKDSADGIDEVQGTEVILKKIATHRLGQIGLTAAEHQGLDDVLGIVKAGDHEHLGYLPIAKILFHLDAPQLPEHLMATLSRHHDIKANRVKAVSLPFVGAAEHADRFVAVAGGQTLAKREEQLLEQNPTDELVLDDEKFQSAVHAIPKC
jgi:hypothetical protein